MATSHRSPPLGTCHTDLSVENKEHKRTYPRPEHKSFEEPRGGWEEMNKMQKAARQLQQTMRKNYVAMAWMHMSSAITIWQLEISQLTMIIDNVICH